MEPHQSILFLLYSLVNMVEIGGKSDKPSELYPLQNPKEFVYKNNYLFLIFNSSR